MEINVFIRNFADQFDETDICEFKPESKFREFEEWSSIIGFSVLNMVENKYGVHLNFGEFGNVDTIEELFEMIMSKKS